MPVPHAERIANSACAEAATQLTALRAELEQAKQHAQLALGNSRISEVDILHSDAMHGYNHYSKHENVLNQRLL